MSGAGKAPLLVCEKKTKKCPIITVVGSDFLPAYAGGSFPENITSPLAVPNGKGGMCAAPGEKVPYKKCW